VPAAPRRGAQQVPRRRVPRPGPGPPHHRHGRPPPRHPGRLSPPPPPPPLSAVAAPTAAAARADSPRGGAARKRGASMRRIPAAAAAAAALLYRSEAVAAAVAVSAERAGWPPKGPGRPEAPLRPLPAAAAFAFHARPSADPRATAGRPGERALKVPWCGVADGCNSESRAGTPPPGEAQVPPLPPSVLPWRPFKGMYSAFVGLGKAL
jgi:hypothetical protein